MTSTPARQPNPLTATALTTKTGSIVTVDLNGVPTDVQCARDLTVAVNDVLTLVRFGATWVALGRLWASSPTPPDPPAPLPPPPTPKPPVITGTSTFVPRSTRSYRTTFGWRDDNDDVYMGEYGGWGNHTGCAFYGGAPESLSGVVVTSATIRVRRPPGTGSTYGAAGSTLWTIAQQSKPSGAPTRLNSAAGPSIAAGATTEFTIPDSFAQALINGTAGGLAFYDSDGSPYLIFAGKSRLSSAMTLTVRWRRG